MKDTAEESAELKQRLKHDPNTQELEDEAERFPLEAAEAIDEVERGLEEAEPGSWVAARVGLDENWED